MSRVVVIGAGIVGAACAYALARDDWEVTIVDRGQVAAGTTSRCEGNLLVSDKGAGPELDLMQLSRRLWLELGDELGRDALELDEKGGLVVARTAEAGVSLEAFASGQRAAGVRAQSVAEVRAIEPELRDGLAGGVFYPDDLQVQPVLATQAIIEAARRRGATLRLGVEVMGVEATQPRGIRGPLRVRLVSGEAIEAEAVVNAAGPWAGSVAEGAGGPLPIAPRRGFILVTRPVGNRVRHKVYSADYVDNVSSDDSGLQTSVVVEGTRSGSILIGASRERVGFDSRLDTDIIRQLATAAVDLFPFLGETHLLRTYRGFRPYAPDHLPVIGPDPRLPGLFHATGHEGAGVGLAPATGRLIAGFVGGAVHNPRNRQSGTSVDGVDVRPFLPARFLAEAAS